MVLGDYAGLTRSDLTAERGDSIDAAMQEFHIRLDALPAVGLPDQEGEIAGISFRRRGAGPSLVLLPLDLLPGHWGLLIPALSARYCTITSEERCDALAIVPGKSVLEVDCGSGPAQSRAPMV